MDMEPRIFPGVVSRRRKSSLRGSGPEEGEAASGQQGYPKFKMAERESVVEEPDTDDEDLE